MSFSTQQMPSYNLISVQLKQAMHYSKGFAIIAVCVMLLLYFVPRSLLVIDKIRRNVGIISDGRTEAYYLSRCCSLAFFLQGTHCYLCLSSWDRRDTFELNYGKFHCFCNLFFNSLIFKIANSFAINWEIIKKVIRIFNRRWEHPWPTSLSSDCQIVPTRRDRSTTIFLHTVFHQSLFYVQYQIAPWW